MRSRHRGALSQGALRVSPGIALLGLACCAVGVWLFWLTIWPCGVLVVAGSVLIVSTAVTRHPPQEAHTGPFARCTAGHPAEMPDRRR